jgi:hypothetical protein
MMALLLLLLILLLRRDSRCAKQNHQCPVLIATSSACLKQQLH